MLWVLVRADRRKPASLLSVMPSALISRSAGLVSLQLTISRLATEYGIDDSRGTLVSLKITHQEMANLIGSTRETVSLTLSQFKRKGLIQTEGRRVILSDMEGLRALA